MIVRANKYRLTDRDKIQYTISILIEFGLCKEVIYKAIVENYYVDLDLLAEVLCLQEKLEVNIQTPKATLRLEHFKHVVDEKLRNGVQKDNPFPVKDTIFSPLLELQKSLSDGRYSLLFGSQNYSANFSEG